MNPMEESIAQAKKAADAVQAYLDKLSEMDQQNMKATVAMFTKGEINDLADNAQTPEKKAFMLVASFLKGIQHVGQ